MTHSSEPKEGREGRTIGKWFGDLGKTALVSVLGGGIAAYVTLSNVVLKVEGIEKRLPAIEQQIALSNQYDALYGEKLSKLEENQKKYTADFVEFMRRESALETRITRLEVTIGVMERTLADVASNVNFLIKSEPRSSPRRKD